MSAPGLTRAATLVGLALDASADPLALTHAGLPGLHPVTPDLAPPDADDDGSDGYTHEQGFGNIRVFTDPSAPRTLEVRRSAAQMAESRAASRAKVQARLARDREAHDAYQRRLTRRELAYWLRALRVVPELRKAGVLLEAADSPVVLVWRVHPDGAPAPHSATWIACDGLSPSRVNPNRTSVKLVLTGEQAPSFSRWPDLAQRVLSAAEQASEAEFAALAAPGDWIRKDKPPKPAVKKTPKTAKAKRNYEAQI